MVSMLPLALQKIENEYLLFGSAGVLCLAAFIGLILVPVVFGLAFVYYYDAISEIFS